MVLPIVGWIAVGATTAIVGWLSHDSGKSSGYNEGLEKGAIGSKKLRENLSEFQKQREELKDEFKEILHRIDEAKVGDDKLISRFMEIVRGYSNFHIFVISCISYARYECIDKDLNSESANELKERILGFVQAGYPRKLKNDIKKIWNEDSVETVQSSLQKNIDRLPQELRNELEDVSLKIQSVIIKLHEVAKKESEVKHQLYLLESA